VLNQLADRFPVTVDDTAKSPFLAQNLLERKWIGRCRHSIDRVEGTHDCRCPGVHGRVKRREIDLPQSVLRDFSGVVIAPALSSSVSDEMLGARGDVSGASRREP